MKEPTLDDDDDDDDRLERAHNDNGFVLSAQATPLVQPYNVYGDPRHRPPNAISPARRHSQLLSCPRQACRLAEQPTSQPASVD